MRPCRFTEATPARWRRRGFIKAAERMRRARGSSLHFIMRPRRKTGVNLRSTCASACERVEISLTATLKQRCDDAQSRAAPRVAVDELDHLC